LEPRLIFVAFGASFDAFEMQIRHVADRNNGVIDALFRITQPLTCTYLLLPGASA
jgi:putative iron-dependent peroxidase